MCASNYYKLRRLIAGNVGLLSNAMLATVVGIALLEALGLSVLSGCRSSSPSLPAIAPTGPTHVRPPTSTITPTSTPTMSPTPTSTRTSTPIPIPTHTPTRTPTKASTPTLTSTQRPPPPPPRLVKPEANATVGRNQVTQVTFEWQWEQDLGWGQTFQVFVLHKPTGKSFASPELLTSRWSTELPVPEYIGDCRWLVVIVQSHKAVAQSEEWNFWFSPFGSDGPVPSDTPPPP